MYIVKKGLVAQEVSINVGYSHCWPKSHSQWERVNVSNEYTKNLVLSTPGKIFGAREIIRKQPRSTYAIARESSTVLVCPKELFFSYFSSEDQKSVMRIEKLYSVRGAPVEMKKSIKKRHIRNQSLKSITKENLLKNIRFEFSSLQNSLIAQKQSMEILNNKQRLKF